MSIVAKNSDEDKKQEFLNTISDTLKKLVKEGLNEKSLQAAINFYEFRYREADFGRYPKGLIYGLRVLSSWLYDDDLPFQNLKDTEIYDFLKKQIKTGYFEKLIKDYIINNNHAALVVLKPLAGLNKIRDDKMKEKLAAYKESLSKEELRNIINETKSLRKYQKHLQQKKN